MHYALVDIAIEGVVCEGGAAFYEVDVAVDAEEGFEGLDGAGEHGDDVEAGGIMLLADAAAEVHFGGAEGVGFYHSAFLWGQEF